MERSDWLERLEALRNRIGAPEKFDSFDQPIEPLKDIETELETTGITVERKDIQSIGPYLAYRGKLAILYIYNSNASSDSLKHNSPASTGTPKFHLTWCSTLEQMHENNRFERYVVSRSKSNLFRVEAKEMGLGANNFYGESRRELEDIRLFPCQNCLSELEYRGFNYSQSKPDRHRQVGDFKISTYLEENDGNLTVMKHLPKTRAENAKEGGYTHNFPEISRRLREEHNWSCSKCGIDMAEKKAGLHVHHINGVKHDNRRKNLQVLCALCHRDIDKHHKTMHIKYEIERYIKSNRPKQ